MPAVLKDTNGGDTLISSDELKWCIEQYADMILRIAVNYCCSIDEAEDIVQNVFLKLIQNNGQFTDEEHRKRWLIRVTVNMCCNEYKSGYKRKTVLTDDISDSSVYSAVVHGEYIEVVEQLRAAVAELPEKLRIVVHLFYYEDYSVKDIASILKKQKQLF